MNTPTDRHALTHLMADAMVDRHYKAPYYVAADVLKALESAGLRVVPAEATERMCQAGFDAGPVRSIGYSTLWGAMVAASPYKPEQ